MNSDYLESTKKQFEYYKMLGEKTIAQLHDEALFWQYNNENNINTRAELLQKWNDGWRCLFDALDSLHEQDLSRTIYIRNQGHSVTEAINRQLAHYPYHIGQIVFIGKMICKENWHSPSIPKGNSTLYNAEKF